MTSRPTEGGKPPLLSREMRLVLALLLLLALLGGWFVWTSNRDAAALADAPSPTPTGDPPAGGEEGTDAAAVTPAPGTGQDGTPQDGATPGPEAAVPVEPSGEIEVPQIPAFGQAEETEAGETAEAVPTPGGINPDIPLAALPGRNPFRPLELERTEGGEAPASPVAAAPEPSAPADPVSLPASEPAPSTGGALALSPLPGTGASRPAPTPSAAATPSPTARPSGALPTPTLPGTGGVSVTRPAPATTSPTASAPRTSRPSASAARPTTASPAASTGRPPGNAAARPAPATSRPSAAVTGTVPPAPRPAPVAGVSVPRDAIDLGAAAPVPAASPAPAPATAPGTPQPVTQFGLEGGVSAASPLGTLVQTRALEFDAAVLGPVNTAIFRSKDGYVVVSQGQTLPDSDAVVREVRAAGVTLELGGETLDLGEEAQPTGLTESLPVVIVRQPADAFSAWGDLAVIAEFDATQTDPPADPRFALALAAPTPDLSRDQGEP
ncbi:hypothetical protein L1280_002054 [Deinococcus sp. HSC-46F16]|uniref:hypothetical protein n=1 Tax=Deinococcus sp. HSC-46F16 TaxID=2910968 RepID=UPI00209F525D|nr:hypothetical protein [Deinococcus sp. HSC-46F16]MCP2014902.1 hypothetical protein [Deinococcus sp. HSC-46F16]